jgi:hypothetical protein
MNMIFHNVYIYIYIYINNVRIYYTFISFVTIKATQFGEILTLNSWIHPLRPPPPNPNQHVFLVLNFPSLAIFIGGKMAKIMQIQRKM